MKIKFIDSFYSLQLSQSKPQTLFLFGDNTMRVGNGGQAIIRNLPNSLGVITKKVPNTKEEAFFRDKDLEEYKEYLEIDMSILREKGKDFDEIVVNKNIGLGLADMLNKCPLCYQELIKTLTEFELK
jgi:hypothetical protein